MYRIEGCAKRWLRFLTEVLLNSIKCFITALRYDDSRVVRAVCARALTKNYPHLKTKFNAKLNCGVYV